MVSVVSAVFVFISPVALDEQMWLVWRRVTRRGDWPPELAGHRYGETLATPKMDGDVSAGGLLDDVEQAIIGSRFNSGVMRQLPQFAQRVHASFDEGRIRGKVSMAAWALASRTDALVVVTAAVVDLSAAELAKSLSQAEARRRFDAAVFGQSVTSDVTEAADYARIVGLPAGPATIQRYATQLLCLIHSPRDLPSALVQIHHTEEGDTGNCAEELDLAQVLGHYLHIGRGNTTAAGKRNHTLMQLIPVAIKTQSVWFAQRQLRTRILALDFGHAQQGRRETTDLLLRLQELRFELHLWDSEIEAYRSGLLPWQAHVMARYVTHWNMDDTYTRLASLVDYACDLLRSTAERFDGIVEARQANILAIIAIIQLIGIAGAVFGYFNLADLSHLSVDSIARTPMFKALVALLPVITGIAILGLTVAARRRR